MFLRRENSLMKNKQLVNLLWSDSDIGGAEVYAKKVAMLASGRIISLRRISIFHLYELFSLLFSRDSVFIFHDFRASLFSIFRLTSRNDIIVIHGPTIYPKLASILFTILSRFVRNVITVQKDMLSLKHVHNIIFLENEASLPFSCNFSGLDFVYFGRVNESKGVGSLCKWWSDKKLSSVLHIIGDGPSLFDYCVRYNRDNIQFHGPLSHEDMQPILEKCSFYISLSDREGLSLALAEAMSIGLVPIVRCIPSQMYLEKQGFPLIIDEPSLANIVQAYLYMPRDDVYKLRSQVRNLWSVRNPGRWANFWKQFPHS